MNNSSIQSIDESISSYIVTNSLNIPTEQPYYRKNLYPGGFNTKNTRIDPIHQQNVNKVYYNAYKHVLKENNSNIKKGLNKSFMDWTRGLNMKETIDDDLSSSNNRDRDPFIDVAGPFYGDGKPMITLYDALPSEIKQTKQSNEMLLPSVSSVHITTTNKNNKRKVKSYQKIYHIPTSLPSVKARSIKHSDIDINEYKLHQNINNSARSPPSRQSDGMDDESLMIVPRGIKLIVNKFTITFMNEDSINSFITKPIEFTSTLEEIQSILIKKLKSNDLTGISLKYFHSLTKQLRPIITADHWETAKASIDKSTKNLVIIHSNSINNHEIIRNSYQEQIYPSLSIQDLNIDIEHLYTGFRDNPLSVEPTFDNTINSLSIKKSTELLNSKISPIVSNQESLALILESRLIKTKW